MNPRTILLSLLPLALLPPTAAAGTATASTANPDQATKLSAIQVQASADPAAKHNDIGSYGPASLHDTPAAVIVIGREQLQNHHVRSLAELARLDAAVGDNYAPVGYYQNVSIRGYPLDFATGYRVNNLIVTGEQRMAFENKQQVQILAGLAGIQAGVMEPGGVVNYVTKRPADVRSLTVGTDQHGTRYTALDVGRWLTPRLGVRANLAWEDLHSYVEHADGRRNFYSLALDWLASDNDRLQLDSDYQASAQRSVSGYKLLGGRVIPPHAQADKLLGYEPWAQPVSIHTWNSQLRYRHDFNEDWHAQLGVGHSRSVIDDNVAFAWGCYYTPECASGAWPGDYFAPNGDYDIYDYRSPHDTRLSNQLRAGVQGHLDGQAIDQDLSVGVSLFHRSIHRPRNVYDYVGSANIKDPTPPVYAPSPDQPGAMVRRFDSWQRTLYALDRIHFGSRWQLVAGAHWVRLHGRAWDDDDAHSRERDTRLTRTLPQAAVLWQPSAALTTYVSWSRGLSLGQEAPSWTDNGGTILPPRLSSQLEAGVKYLWRQRLALQAALYRIHQPWQFAQPHADGRDFTFVQRGQEVHTGLALSAHGRLTPNLSTHASVSWIRARAQDTGTPAYEGHQIVNVPAWRSVLGLDYTLPGLPGLTLSGGWRHAAANPATADGRVRVAAYDVFNLGLRYRMQRPDYVLTWRLSVDNVLDHFYWRDTGATGGDSYLFPGAPRLARLTVTLRLPESP